MTLSLRDFTDAVLCNDLSTTKGNIFLGYIETDPEPFLVEVKDFVPAPPHRSDSCTRFSCEDCPFRLDCLLEGMKDEYTDLWDYLESHREHPAWEEMYRSYKLRKEKSDANR